MFQKEVEGITMVMMTKVAEFMKEHIIPQDLRQTHEIEIQIDIIPGRTTTPVCGIMLYGNPVICKSVSVRQLLQT
jgi:hypothetical protein